MFIEKFNARDPYDSSRSRIFSMMVWRFYKQTTPGSGALLLR